MKLKWWIFVFVSLAYAGVLYFVQELFGFSITGLIVMVFVLLGAIVLTIKLSLNVRWLRKLILRSFSASRVRLSCDLGSSPLAKTVIFILGFVLGLAVYIDRTNAFYHDLSEAYCRADVLTDVFSSENGTTWPPLAAAFRVGGDPCESSKLSKTARLDMKQLFRLLRHYNLLDPDDSSEEALIQASQAKPEKPSTNRNAKLAGIVASDSFKFTPGEPTIDLVLAMAAGLTGTDKHPNCPQQSDILQRHSFAGALAQQPYPSESIDPKRLRGIPTKTEVAVFDREPIGRVLQQLGEPSIHPEFESEVCADYLKGKEAGIATDLPLWSSFTFERPEPELTSQELASLAVQWHIPTAGQSRTFDTQQDDAVLKFMAVLLSEMRGTEVVRSDRRLVNALIGKERCAVIMLACVFSIFLFVRFVKRLPHEIHRTEIVSRMDDFRKKWHSDESGRVEAKVRCADARVLRDSLVNGYLADEKGKEQPHQVTTIPLRILGAALDEMDLATKNSDPNAKVESTFVETVSDGERRSLDGSRLVFDTLLPTFPAIGFVGTVSSLLVAMSEADRIVKTDDALARGVAASQVTDILSLCFSTTLLALLCVLVFSPFSLMQASRERSLIDDTEYEVQRVLRPEQP
jgi:hypothetical protein